MHKRYGKRPLCKFENQKSSTYKHDKGNSFFSSDLCVLGDIHSSVSEMFKYSNQTMIIVSPKKRPLINELFNLLTKLHVHCSLSQPYPQLQDGRSFWILSHTEEFLEVKSIVESSLCPNLHLEPTKTVLRSEAGVSDKQIEKLKEKFEEYFPASNF